MSDPVRIALVAEGPTDKVVIEAAIRCILGEAPFILRQLQPEESIAFLDPADGTGWGGVYRWCLKAISRSNGAIETDVLFVSYSLLILHLDADVAAEEYANAGINHPVNNLPCSLPCPPASASTDRLRAVLLSWIGRDAIPGRTVLCTPSKSTDGWVLCALYPDDQAVQAGAIECLMQPHNRLQAKPKNGRLVSGGKKRLQAYRARAPEMSASWPNVRGACSEAARFSQEIEVALRALPPQ
jgi:hypothetical protein